MDIGTVLGIFSGILLIIISILLGSGLDIFISFPSMMIVVGGTAAATLISFPLPEVIGVVRVAGKAFRFRIRESSIFMIELITLAQKCKRSGLLQLPALAKKLNDPFLTKGCQMLADGIEREEIIRTLDTEILLTQSRHQIGQNIFKAMGRYAPAFGMIGTLIGLIQMLSNLNDPEALGPGMATAMLTTFYGATLANLLFLPMASKLKRRSEQEFLLSQIAKESILSMETGESITLLQDKLSSFISRSLQRNLESATARDE
jgi:chemotaxis protein MotA